MMDEYRKGWALRYLREAKAELEAARKIPYMAPSLVLESIRKARNAIYYSLGEPAFIEVLVREEARKDKPTNESSGTTCEDRRQIQAASFKLSAFGLPRPMGGDCGCPSGREPFGLRRIVDNRQMARRSSLGVRQELDSD